MTRFAIVLLLVGCSGAEGDDFRSDTPPKAGACAWIDFPVTGEASSEPQCPEGSELSPIPIESTCYGEPEVCENHFYCFKFQCG